MFGFCCAQQSERKMHLLGIDLMIESQIVRRTYRLYIESEIERLREENTTDTDRVSDHSRGKIFCCLSLFLS